MKPLIKNKNKINSKNPNKIHFTPLYCCLWVLLSFKYIKTMMIIKEIAKKTAKIVCPCENMLIKFSTNLRITIIKI
jgi:hypothetical protein